MKIAGQVERLLPYDNIIGRSAIGRRSVDGLGARRVAAIFKEEIN
jgi:hypothetical protein